jgi:Pyruvate/2-oxoacid:ferredoxin oxidoreductase delta subunit
MSNHSGKDVYHKLARRLDLLTNGYPPTESGIELKILRRIFRSEDAEVALKLRPNLEPAHVIAKRFRKTPKEMTEILDDMAKRKQINSLGHRGEQRYGLAPFILGFWEFQVDVLDRELCDMFDEYANTLVHRVGGQEPSLTRVIPLNSAIDADLEILRYEDLRNLIAESKSIQLFDCICRKKKDLQESRKCSHDIETCMLFFRDEGVLARHHWAGRVTDAEEALAVLDKTEEDGLVHCTYNTRSNIVWVCNCCPCCCDLLVGLLDHKAPHLVAKSNFTAVINNDECSECGVCAEERCPTEAIVRQNDDGYRISAAQCLGCGVCVPTCPTGAIQLIRKPKEEQDNPPADLIKWHLRRGVHRAKTYVKKRLGVGVHE